MPIEVQGPDGNVHTFPDGMPPDAINAAMSQRYGGKSGSLKSATPPGLMAAPPTVPQAGSPTAASGGFSQNMTQTPSYLDPQTLTNLGLVMLDPQSGRAAASVLDSAPGYKQAQAQATEVGKDLGKLQEKQRAAIPVVQQLQELRHVAINAGEKNLMTSTGPDLAEGVENSAISSLLPNTHSPTYQYLRGSVSGDGVGENSPYAISLTAQHLKKSIATLFKATGGGSGGGSTDQAQRELEDAVGEAQKARDPETFFRILNDAENMLRSYGGLPRLPSQDRYTPPGFGPAKVLPPAAGAVPSQGAPSPPPVNGQGGAPMAPPQPMPGDPRSFANAGVAPPQAPQQPPAEAIADLRKNTSAKNRAYFDEVFGPGASDAALRAR